MREVRTTKRQDDPWLTVEEVADLAGVCYQTAWRAAKRGELKARQRKPGSPYKVRESWARAWAKLDER